ncbi:MAG: hypothetical protein KGZ97_01100 [Bacteroidetes bacterium]|nr:hypothetical protein [Bacteroidota bacterium]
MKRNILFWIIASIITLASAYYQRATGPTHPFNGKVNLSGTEIKYKLIRSFPMPMDAPIRVNVEDTLVTGCFKYKRYPSHDEWTYEDMVRKDGQLIAYIPQQPHAGKVMYKIFLEKNGEEVELSEKPLIIRFRGDVPAWAMIPHIILMFAAMLFSMRVGIAAIFKDKTFKLTLLTLIFLLAGGLIFGPIVQKYAFGDYWTGWPFGTDLTDNKTALAFIFWLFAFYKTYKNHNHRTWVVVASIVLLLIYLIPHSMFGSEIDFRE